MIKKIIAKVFKLGGGSSFWKYLERKQQIKQIDREFQNLLIGLQERQDAEFRIYAAAKFLELQKKQQKLCQCQCGLDLTETNY
jgi:acetone carboxylase gamma subunit